MLNLMSLQGRTILVTGASSGLGRETAILLSALGAKLVLVARNRERLEATAALLEGQDHLIEPFDLSEMDAIAPWMKNLVKRSGPLHGVVHSAGNQKTLPLRFMSQKDLDGIMGVSLGGAIGLAKGFRQKGVCQSSDPEATGSIVFLASIMALVGQPGISAYCASKGAISALTRSLALELAPEKIRVNCVAPAYVMETEMSERLLGSLSAEQFEAIKAMHPLGLGRPRDVANAIAFLTAETGRWITGTTLVVDGGYTAH